MIPEELHRILIGLGVQIGLFSELDQAPFSEQEGEVGVGLFRSEIQALDHLVAVFDQSSPALIGRFDLLQIFRLLPGRLGCPVRQGNPFPFSHQLAVVDNHGEQLLKCL